MLVCHCHRVTDRTLRELARSGARTCEAVAAACGAGAACGGCRELVECIIDSEGCSSQRPKTLTLLEPVLEAAGA